MPGRDGPVGLLTVAHGGERGPFSAEDLTTARHAAARAGLVLDNARLFRQQRELAEGLQRSLLTPPPQPDHLQIVVRYVPAARAAEVGGDWYDAFLQPAGATVLVIGDVIGHDIAAAAAMGQIRSIVRTIGAEDGAAPGEILRRADQVMETLQTGTAATAVVARLEQTDSERTRGVTRLRWSNAGHPPPMAINPDGTVLPMATVPADRLSASPPACPDASPRSCSTATPSSSSTPMGWWNAATRTSTPAWHGCSESSKPWPGRTSTKSATNSSNGCSSTALMTTSPSSPSDCTHRTSPARRAPVPTGSHPTSPTHPPSSSRLIDLAESTPACPVKELFGAPVALCLPRGS